MNTLIKNRAGRFILGLFLCFAAASAFAANETAGQKPPEISFKNKERIISLEYDLVYKLIGLSLSKLAVSSLQIDKGVLNVQNTHVNTPCVKAAWGMRSVPNIIMGKFYMNNLVTAYVDTDSQKPLATIKEIDQIMARWSYKFARAYRNILFFSPGRIDEFLAERTPGPGVLRDPAKDSYIKRGMDFQAGSVCYETLSFLCLAMLDRSFFERYAGRGNPGNFTRYFYADDRVYEVVFNTARTSIKTPLMGRSDCIQFTVKPRLKTIGGKRAVISFWMAEYEDYMIPLAISFHLPLGKALIRIKKISKGAAS